MTPRLHAVALFLLAICSCHRGPCSSVPGPTPRAMSSAAAAAPCAAVCAHMRTLGCAAATPTPKGASCEEVCITVQTSGVVAWDLDCRSKAPTCDAIDACERERCP